MIIILSQYCYLNKEFENLQRNYNKINYLLTDYQDIRLINSSWSCYAKYPDSHFYI
jgi:hypothetical protein